MASKVIQIIGGGLSGCEAALQLAAAGVTVTLFEMRPKKQTPAHKTGGLAELVCSNSFKGLAQTSAHGLFKKELRQLGSKLIAIAHDCRVPAGESLTVDREKFSLSVENAIRRQPGISLHRKEITELNPELLTLVATGPLTSNRLSNTLQKILGKGQLAFFDAISPVVFTDSINFNHTFIKNRWEKGDTEDFINCPLNKAEYAEFVQTLKQADAIEEKPFEKKELFEGCLPIEEMARRGADTLRFGPLRPVGLKHPETGEKFHAVLQLRAENTRKSLYNLVGCQTRLKQATQRASFSIIPALRNAKYARFGAIHRNTFIRSPELLDESLNLKGTNLYFSGQITGAEGYTEAIATGLYVATMIYARLKGIRNFQWPQACCTGALVRHLVSPNPDFQPMNMNFGLLPRPEGVKKAQRKEFLVKQCLDTLEGFKLPRQV